ncbi:MAG: GNAT family N-acetyltransferase, partial [Candidatus Brocadiia bacterium]|nr:GNAT family N-acetyltransferase [Candidatus Brocadiia bacterium]
MTAHADQAIGMMHAFAMPEPEPGGEAPDPVLRPYAELEVAGSLYIAGMALLPEHRGRGIGSWLLVLAKERARADDQGQYLEDDLAAGYVDNDAAAEIRGERADIKNR